MAATVADVDPDGDLILRWEGFRARLQQQATRTSITYLSNLRAALGYAQLDDGGPITDKEELYELAQATDADAFRTCVERLALARNKASGRGAGVFLHLKAAATCLCRGLPQSRSWVPWADDGPTDPHGSRLRDLWNTAAKQASRESTHAADHGNACHTRTWFVVAMQALSDWATSISSLQLFVAVHLMIRCGARPSSVSGLTWSQVIFSGELDTNIKRARANRTDHMRVWWRGTKGDRHGTGASVLLAEHPDGAPYCIVGMLRLLRDKLEPAGEDRVFPFPAAQVNKMLRQRQAMPLDMRARDARNSFTRTIRRLLPDSSRRYKKLADWRFLNDVVEVAYDDPEPVPEELLLIGRPDEPVPEPTLVPARPTPRQRRVIVSDEEDD